jgi:CHAT domain-containing protein
MLRTGTAPRDGSPVRPGDPALPIVCLSSAPDEELTSVLRDIPLTEIMIVRDLDLAAITQALLAARGRLGNVAPPLLQKPSSAQIEIVVRQAMIEMEAQVGVLVKRFDPIEWFGRRELELIEAEFREHERERTITETVIAHARTRLNWYLLGSRLNDALQFCRENTREETKIQVRFALLPDDLEHVPFELAGTGNQEEYMRDVYPVARKLHVPQQHRDPNRSLKPRVPSAPRVLLLVADVHGELRKHGRTFKGEKTVNLAALRHLADERERLITLHGIEKINVVELKQGSALKTLSDALKAGPFDVIHFTGHSVKSDVGSEVFLALPGNRYGRILAFSADDFARLAAEADARLVILSSCENCSSRALLRMAAFGVPSVIGFRWPVDDSDAAEFTPMLHRKLFVDGLAVAHAFYEALIEIKTPASDWLTRFSPILMLQNTRWHEYGMEDAVT